MRQLTILPLLLLLLPLFSVYTGTASAETPRELSTVTLGVEHMTCSLCPYTVNKALSAVPGVREAKVDFGSKTATVTYDPTRTNVKALTEATANAGYPSHLR